MARRNLTDEYKVSKAELADMNEKNELDANNKLDKLVSGELGQDRVLETLRKERTTLKQVLSESFFSNYRLIFSRNWGHLYPYDSLSDVEKVEATVRGLFVFSTILILYTNMRRIASGETYFYSIFASNLRWIGLTLVCIGIYICNKRYSLQNEIKAVESQIAQRPSIVAEQQKRLKNNLRLENSGVEYNQIEHDNYGAIHTNALREPLRQESNVFSTHMGFDLFKS